MGFEKITLLEKIAIHSVDPFEYTIKLWRGKRETWKHIYKKHEAKYASMLKAVQKYNGNVPRELREKILSCAQPCTMVRFYTACTRARFEKIQD